MERIDSHDLRDRSKSSDPKKGQASHSHTNTNVMANDFSSSQDDCFGDKIFALDCSEYDYRLQ